MFLFRKKRFGDFLEKAFDIPFFINVLSLTIPIFTVLQNLPLAAALVFMITACAIIRHPIAGTLLASIVWITFWALSIFRLSEPPSWSVEVFAGVFIARLFLVLVQSYLLSASFKYVALSFKLSRIDKKHRQIYRFAMKTIRKYESTYESPDGVSFQNALRQRLINFLSNLKDLRAYVIDDFPPDIIANAVLFFVLVVEYDYTCNHRKVKTREHFLSSNSDFKAFARYLCPLIEGCDRKMCKSGVVLGEEYEEYINPICTWYDREDLYNRDPNKRIRDARNIDEVRRRVNQFEQRLGATEQEKIAARDLGNSLPSTENLPRGADKERIRKLRECYCDERFAKLRLRNELLAQLDEIDKDGAF